HRLTPESQVVVKVFDPRPDWSRPGPEQADPYAENGRGLQIVKALAWRWGWHPSRSRLATHNSPGKATWFCLPITGRCEEPGHPRLSVPQAAQALLSELAGRGITRLQCQHGPGRSLVALPGLTVWSEEPGTFRWQDPTRERGGYLYKPVADLVDVAEEAVRIHEHTAAAEAARTSLTRLGTGQSQRRHGRTDVPDHGDR
ncbi:MAG TPA: hypothetical protein VGP70_19430, partial [Actinomadura sp.]|nr:hypothetical protein [Actinomadura sp.]